MLVKANLIDIEAKAIYFAAVQIEDGIITEIRREQGESRNYILPGFVDAHVHIESSMLVPSEFARLAVVHGTVATVSDPHEIANVLGLKGVFYMLDNGQKVPFKFNFGAPSCVPATTFETAGAVLDVKDVCDLLKKEDILYLSEMMNYPGVLFNDPDVMAKIAAAHELGKPVDGHAPGLRGEDARKYVAAGISTDHECFTYDEAFEKIEYGMKILIREGSAAKNFDALIDLLPKFPDKIMFCSDDKHPDDLIEGHINQLAARAVNHGCNVFDVLRAACINPVEHYSLPVGLLRVGDPADFIIVDNLRTFEVKATYIDGQIVAKKGESTIASVPTEIINNFNTSYKSEADFGVVAESDNIHVIKAIDGEIVTESFVAPAKVVDGQACSDLENDVLKITVVNRYGDTPPSMAFINGFQLKGGAIASCVGHDSHNIIAVGDNDDSICKAVNLIIENEGGISAVYSGQEKVLPLPVAGIMSNADGYTVAVQYAAIDQFVKEEMGCALTAPFMTLSFMALLVIPQLKLSDKGLFDGGAFAFQKLFT